MASQRSKSRKVSSGEKVALSEGDFREIHLDIRYRTVSTEATRRKYGVVKPMDLATALVDAVDEVLRTHLHDTLVDDVDIWWVADTNTGEIQEIQHQAVQGDRVGTWLIPPHDNW